MTSKKIYLIGLMGAGKSTVGKLLARNLGWKFLDLDHEIEVQLGKDISSIFAEEHEAGFRKHETRALKGTADLQEVVVACGGGIVTRSENVEFLKNETTVWLEISAEEAAKRLVYSKDRPLLNECEDTKHELQEILSARQTAYTEAAQLKINSGEFPAELIACDIKDEIEKLDA